MHEVSTTACACVLTIRHEYAFDLLTTFRLLNFIELKLHNNYFKVIINFIFKLKVGGRSSGRGVTPDTFSV